MLRFILILYMLFSPSQAFRPNKKRQTSDLKDPPSLLSLSETMGQEMSRAVCKGASDVASKMECGKSTGCAESKQKLEKLKKQCCIKEQAQKFLDVLGWAKSCHVELSEYVRSTVLKGVGDRETWATGMESSLAQNAEYVKKYEKLHEELKVFQADCANLTKAWFKDTQQAKKGLGTRISLVSESLKAIAPDNAKSLGLLQTSSGSGREPMSLKQATVRESTHRALAVNEMREGI